MERGDRCQTLLGVTGSGKTYTMASTIARAGRPALIFAPNKTLAAQLFSEFKQFFPENAVEYFVSYYDYYQPEAYVPERDLFIDKDAKINEELEKLRLSATRNLLERRDTIVIASVSLHLRPGGSFVLHEPVRKPEGGPDTRSVHPAARPGGHPVPAQPPELRARHLPGAGRRGGGLPGL